MTKLHATKKLLFCWIGFADIRACQDTMDSNLGPTGEAALARQFSTIILLSDHQRNIAEAYREWLEAVSKIRVKVHHVHLSGPTNFGEIYEAALTAVESEKRLNKHEVLEITYHLSPGTPAMAAVWILLAKTSHPAELIESSPENGVQTVSFPFELAADYLPDVTRTKEDEIIQLTRGLPPKAPEFGQIVHRCKAMKRIVAMARRIAVLSTILCKFSLSQFLQRGQIVSHLSYGF